jgi:hypothetical protein
MATQVKPGLIQPKRFTGHQKSADVIRNQPAYSIRARGHVSQTGAECMAAIYTCKAGIEKNAWQEGGRPCMKRDSNDHRLDCCCPPRVWELSTAESLSAPREARGELAVNHGSPAVSSPRCVSARPELIRPRSTERSITQTLRQASVGQPPSIQLRSLQTAVA